MATGEAGRDKAGNLAGQTIGFIGLGLMGRLMVPHLLAAGARVVVWNRSRPAVEVLAAAGCEAAGSPAEVAEAVGSGITILMLWDGRAIEELLGPAGGFFDRLPAGALVIDMGTTDVATTGRLHARLRERGSRFLDAPVSGGQAGARAGTLSIFVGGEREDFDRALPVLRTMGERITWMGEGGAGQVTKAANQLIVGETITAVAEALRLAGAAGVDPARVREALRGGFADSRILDLHGARMISGDLQPGGRAAGQLKDMRQALELAESLGLDLPALRENRKLWERVVEGGLGEFDHSAVYAFLGGEMRER